MPIAPYLPNPTAHPSPAPVLMQKRAPCRKAKRKKGYSVLVIDDFHFNGYRLLENIPTCTEALEVAVMGCVVNGSGESKSANIGESPVAPVYEDGVKTVTLKGDHIAEEFQGIVQRYIETHYGENKEKSVV